MAWFWGNQKINQKISSIRELADRLETVERGFRSLKLEWEDTYDRLRHMAGRQRKRDARMEASADTETEELPGVKPNGSPVSIPEYTHPDEATWSPATRALNQSIMERRRRLSG